MNIPFPHQVLPALQAFTVLYVIALVIVHIGFAAAVAMDSARVGPLIAGPLLWTLATLLGGVLVAGLYWLVNHSTLSRREG